MNITFNQTENASTRLVADNFERHYNSGNFEAIFSNFSIEMKNAQPLEKTKQFLTELKTQAGKITKKQFVKYEQSYASYKTEFEKALLEINISVNNDAEINGLLLRPFKETNIPKPDRNSTKLILPFKNEWTVIWGGDTIALNYHVEMESQKNAFDFVITNDRGHSFETDGIRNEDYYAFGKDIVAPCDGEVVLVVDGIKDNEPGVLNAAYVPGNTVIVKTGNDEYLFFAHFKQYSIVVKQGQKVKQGALLGLCGNSGNSSEPHLHFHIQNVEDINSASGIKCYFDKINVNQHTQTDYSPIQYEKVSNVENE